MPEVTDTVMQQQEAVRRSGKANMMNKDLVQFIAYESDYHALVTFIEESSHEEYIEMAEEAADWYNGVELGVEPVPEMIKTEVKF